MQRRNRTRSKPCSTTRCAPSGKTTSSGRGERSSASLPARPTSTQPQCAYCATRTTSGTRSSPTTRKKAGKALTALLKDHILIAVDILKAAKAGDAAAVADANKRWYANADQIAGFLNKANPHNWGLKPAKAMMRMHLDETLKEAVDRLNGRFAADIRDYDSVHHHILKMADMLSSGIIKQFPARFR
jgi:hypothetical protein